MTMKALSIIRDEHRSIAAVLNGMLYLVSQIRERGMKPAFDVFGAMIYYIDAFPERFHHPKEDAYLFRALRERCPDAAALLDQLHEEHAAGAQKIRVLEQALTRYQNGGAAEFAAFADAVESYADFHWKHMRAEETEVFPLAEAYLTPADWEAIDAAFSGNDDPIVGADSRYQHEALFRRIVNLAPPPIGVGPAAEAEKRQPGNAPTGRR